MPSKRTSAISNLLTADKPELLVEIDETQINQLANLIEDIKVPSNRTSVISEQNKQNEESEEKEEKEILIPGEVLIENNSLDQNKVKNYNLNPLISHQTSVVNDNSSAFITDDSAVFLDQEVQNSVVKFLNANTNDISPLQEIEIFQDLEQNFDNDFVDLKQSDDGINAAPKEGMLGVSDLNYEYNMDKEFHSNLANLLKDVFDDGEVTQNNNKISTADRFVANNNFKLPESNIPSVRIDHIVATGNNKLSIQLYPMGDIVDFNIEVQNNGLAKLSITADSAETLLALKESIKELEAQLKNIGIETGSSHEFNLRENNQEGYGGKDARNYLKTNETESLVDDSINLYGTNIYNKIISNLDLYAMIENNRPISIYA